jgi:methyltransferase (TIGR00027 family)
MLESSLKAHPSLASGSGNYVVVRTRFYDDVVLASVLEGIRQVVIMGAGMDARSYRLPWPCGTTMYEIDHPELLRLKEELLQQVGAQPACRRIPIGIDLKEGWTHALVHAGFVPSEPALWLAEGVLPYLEESIVRSVLASISDNAAPGSVLATDLISASFLSGPWMKERQRTMESRGIGWQFGTDDPEGLLGAYGWMAQVTQPGDEGANYGRWSLPVLPRDVPNVPRMFLTVGRRRNTTEE